MVREAYVTHDHSADILGQVSVHGLDGWATLVGAF